MKKARVKRKDTENNDKLPGYELYPSSEDIYKKDKEEKDIDPEDISERVNSLHEIMQSEKDSGQDESGSDLDIPGSELDDDMENIGSEDEENNYYSLSDDYSEDDKDIPE
jgi:hypothetical protein